MKNVLFALLLGIGSFVFISRYETRRDIMENGIEILVPVYVRETQIGERAAKISFRYHSFIPASEILSGSGTAVVRRHSGGRASYVRIYDSQTPLRPGEHLLKFYVEHEAGLQRGTALSKVKFASDEYILRSKEKVSELMDRPKELRIKYAVLKTNGDGDSALWGMADQNGVILSTRY